MNLWYNINKPIILASSSPRRKEILGTMGVNFTTISPEIENENEYLKGDNIVKSLETLAFAKAENVAKDNTNSLVLGSDTVVVLGKNIIGKPKNRNDAAKILHSLSGKTHKVLTAISLISIDFNFAESTTAVTEVYFRDIEKYEIEHYLDENEYSDKAGAYAIQGKAMNFVNKIDGCFYNVMGLPVTKTIELFSQWKKSSHK